MVRVQSTHVDQFQLQLIDIKWSCNKVNQFQCYVDNKSKSVKEKYTAIVSEKYSQDPSSQSEFDPQAWISATGVPLKGRVYGFGSSGKSSFLISNECSSHIFDKNNAHETLYTKEEVHQQIHETINKMRAEIEAECVKKMEEKMEEKMKTYLGNIGSNHSDEDNGSGA